MRMERQSKLIRNSSQRAEVLTRAFAIHVLDMWPRNRLFVQVRFRGYSSIATIGLRPLILTGS
jgi:hypothetical protein